MRKLSLFVNHPVPTSLEPGIKALAQSENFSVHALKLDADFFPLLLEAKPCIVLAAIDGAESSAALYQLMKEFKDYRVSESAPARDPAVRIVIVAEGQLPRLNWAHLGIYELMVGPVLPNVLAYKLSRHYQKAVTASEHEVRVEAEAPMVVAETTPEWRVFKRSELKEPVEQEELRTQDEPVETVSLRVKIPNVDEKNGEWVTKEDPGTGDEYWEWENKVQPSTEGLSWKWAFYGSEEPIYNPEDGSWEFNGPAPRLLRVNSQTKVDEVLFEYHAPTGRETFPTLKAKPEVDVRSVKTQKLNRRGTPLAPVQKKERERKTSEQNFGLSKPEKLTREESTREASAHAQRPGKGSNDSLEELERSALSPQYESRNSDSAGAQRASENEKKSRDVVSREAALSKKIPATLEMQASEALGRTQDQDLRGSAAEASRGGASASRAKTSSPQSSISTPSEDRQIEELLAAQSADRTQKSGYNEEASSRNKKNRDTVELGNAPGFEKNRSAETPVQTPETSQRLVGESEALLQDESLKYSEPVHTKNSLQSSSRDQRGIDLKSAKRSNDEAPSASGVKIKNNSETDSAPDFKNRSSAKDDKNSFHQIKGSPEDQSLSALFDDDPSTSKNASKSRSAKDEALSKDPSTWKFELVKKIPARVQGVSRQERMAPPQKLTQEEKRSLMERIIRFILGLFR